MSALRAYAQQVAGAALHRRVGWVRRVQGVAIESEGPASEIGELCRIRLSAADRADVLAEVVGFRAGAVTLMAYGTLHGVEPGAQVTAVGQRGTIGVGQALLGRVIDGFGAPLDGRPAPATSARHPLQAPPVNPLSRPPVREALETGVRCIDGLLTLGRGQRVGIFAGSGVGKSTLLGMIARHVEADVNVIALVGERSREVRDFVERQLDPAALARSVVVVASSDQPALARVRAAHAAVAVAAWFRDQGRHVLLTLDSMTRLAMARREIGLASGEPATARGYTPSVFAELPQVCERCGTAASGGSVTALLTVLVEGDDLAEPVSDSLRAILDGHIVLSRDLAQQGQHPAIDVLRSASRLLPVLAGERDRELAATAVRRLAVLERNRQLVDIGAYQKGGNPALDEALASEAGLLAWMRQTSGGVPRGETLRGLAEALAGGATA